MDQTPTMADLETLESEALRDLETAADLETFRQQHLGPQGKIRAMSARLSLAPVETKQSLANRLFIIRRAVTSALNERVLAEREAMSA